MVQVDYLLSRLNTLEEVGVTGVFVPFVLRSTVLECALTCMLHERPIWSARTAIFWAESHMCDMVQLGNSDPLFVILQTQHSSCK